MGAGPYTPTTKGNYFDAKRCTEEFSRKLKAKYKYRDTNNTNESLFYKKSNKPIGCDNEELRHITCSLENLEPENRTQEDNISQLERTALHELKNDQRIIIK